MELKDYMKIKYPFEIIPDEYEGGYAIAYPDLPGCLSCGDTIEETIKNGEDARLAWISASLEDGHEIPLPDSMTKYSGQFKLRIPKELHRDLARKAKREGVSMNQYCLYLLSKNSSN